jgi:hypothetical protein
VVIKSGADAKSIGPSLTSFQDLVMPSRDHASYFNHDQSMSPILTVIASICVLGR